MPLDEDRPLTNRTFMCSLVRSNGMLFRNSITWATVWIGCKKTWGNCKKMWGNCKKTWGNCKTMCEGWSILLVGWTTL